jgi:uncharacterized membrane protein YvbJ
MATIETICTTRQRGDKTICTLCGKDVTEKARLTREEIDAAFAEMDGAFERMSKMFRRIFR